MLFSNSIIILIIVNIILHTNTIQANSQIYPEETFNEEIALLNEEIEEINNANNSQKIKTLNHAGKIYRQIYKTDKLYRQKNNMNWTNIDFDSAKSIPVVLLSVKQSFGKTIDKLISKLKQEKQNRLFWLKHYKWWGKVRENINQIQKHPHIYDHYYSFVHHNMLSYFTFYNLMLNYLQQERILQELDFIKNKIRQIIAYPSMYQNKKDFIRILRKYFESRKRKTIDDPIPGYRWYGPKSISTSYDKIVKTKLNLNNLARRFQSIKSLLETALRYMEEKNNKTKTSIFPMKILSKKYAYKKNRTPRTSNIFFMLNTLKN